MTRDVELDPAKVEDAQRAVGRAKLHLQTLLRESPVAGRSEKVLISAPVRAALSTLRDAKAELNALRSTPSLSAVDHAEEALRSCQAHLERVLGGEATDVSSGDDKWVSATVERAFAELRAAQQVLSELHSEPAREGARGDEEGSRRRDPS